MSDRPTAATTVDYEYHGLKASTWDLFLGQSAVWEDTLFFREMIVRHGQPALELGCGTGRLLLDYLADGFDVDGVDNSPEMLDICREKAARRKLKPHLFWQSMEQLSLPRRYQTIIIPAGSFQLITDLVPARQALLRIVDHLQPGGVLAMRFMLLWQPGQPQQPERRLVGEVIRPEDGARVRWWQRSCYDVANQLESVKDLYEVLSDGQVIASEQHLRSPAARWYTREQAQALLHEAGLVNIQLVEVLAATEPDQHFAVVGQSG